MGKAEKAHSVSSRADTSEGDVRRKLFLPSPLKLLDSSSKLGPMLLDLNIPSEGLEPISTINPNGFSFHSSSLCCQVHWIMKANFKSPDYPKVENP